MTPIIGVLALQGDFREHAHGLRALGAEVREVRRETHLSGLDGLIIPGGESTTIARLLLRYGLHQPVRRLGRGGLPIWGTCAGAILLADNVPDLDRPPLGLLPMTVERNAYGRQIDSFETYLPAAGLPPTPNGAHPPYHAIFIRAPRIRRVGADVTVLMRHEGEPVAVRRAYLLATTFHPELTMDRRWHACFLDMVTAGAGARQKIAPYEGVA